MKEPIDSSDVVLDGVIRKNIWRIIPFLAIAYLFNFLDRTSVGFAALQMNQALGLSPSEFGWGAGILFISYCLLEVPSSLAMYRFGARRWLARIMITWGLTAALTAFAVGPLSFYAVRFLLGVFEAGFFPGVLWYISIWFPSKYRARAMALFIAAAPLSQLVGGPISVALLQMDGRLGLGGWQWMFLLEGLPAVVLGILCLRVLTDEPKDATWLTGPEHAVLIMALAAETHERPKKDLWGAMRDGRVLMSIVIIFCYTSGSYGLSLWLPLILKEHYLSNTAIGWVSSIPFLFATLATLVFANLVDKTGFKAYTLIFTLSLGIVGLTLAVIFTSLVPALIALTIGLVGVISARTIFYTIPPLFLTGAAAAGGFAFMNSLGALGGFAGPGIVGWLKDTTGSYSDGLVGMAALLVIAIVFSVMLKRTVRSA